MADLNKEFIVNLQGKDFVTYNGLVDLAHQMDLQSITTELIQLPSKDNNNQCIFKAVATTKDGKVFEGYGDADPSNVNKMIAKHMIRMAETRAKARALRDLTNVGMTAYEEMGGEEPAGSGNDEDEGIESNLASEKQRRFINKLVKDKNYGVQEIRKHISETYKKDKSDELTKQEASEIIKMLTELDKK